MSYAVWLICSNDGKPKVWHVTVDAGRTVTVWGSASASLK